LVYGGQVKTCQLAKLMARVLDSCLPGDGNPGEDGGGPVETGPCPENLVSKPGI
jgi:hypothetical protein